jgi:trimethylamine--corrinoid protein Co-methyltransferase
MREFGSRAFRVLSESQCEQIHEASLSILERTGVRFLDPGALEVLRSAGAAVSDGNLVRFPKDLVTWAIGVTPAEVVMHDREGLPVMRLGGRNVYFGTGSDCHNILDSRTGERRRFLKADVAQGIRVCDALEGLDFVLSIGLISDVPRMSSDVHQFDAMIRNTTKPVVFTSHDLANTMVIVAMAEAIAGGREQLDRAPTIIHFAEVDCPLKYAADTCQKVMFMARRGLPVVQGAGPMMGASGPQTHAGVLAAANAECLAGNVLVELTREGAPFIRGLGIHPLDMRTGVLPYGAPELSLNTAAACDLARYYGVPAWGYAGCSDAKLVDQQAAAEATMSVVASLLAGANLVHDVGYIESGLTSSFEMIVFSDTVIQMGRAMLKDIEISDETLALDLIDSVGHYGNYLGEVHTRRHFREVWYPDLMDRQTYQGWEAAGHQTMGDRLSGRVSALLQSHASPPLPEAVDSELARLLGEADSRAALAASE